MAGLKRAVSPLIATILLVGLTVAIGAMVVGWGQQYVKQQTECLRIDLDIQSASMDVTNNKLLVTVFNSGTAPLDTTSTGQKLKFVAMIGGTAYTCSIDTNAPATNGCRIVPTTNKLDPGSVNTLEIEFGTGLSVQNIEEGYFIYGTCGSISRHITALEITT